MVRKAGRITEWRPELVEQATNRKLDREFHWAGELMMRRTRNSLVYRDRPSVPGETPSLHEGLLATGITYVASPQSVALGVLDVLPGEVPYHLEQIRPYLSPVMEQSIPDILEHMQT